MFKRPELSKLIYTKNQIIIHGFKLNHVHPGNFMPLKLESINYKKNLNLNFSNSLIGKFQNGILHKDQNSIYLYFENLKPGLNLDYHWAAMHISPKILQCPVCKSFFNKNESPCRCIKDAPFFNLMELTLDSVHLHSYKTDNEDSYDCRNDLYSKFFNRSLHNLSFLEPI